MQNFIFLGPDSSPYQKELVERKIFDFRLLESIEFDPILAAFWRQTA